MAADKRDIKADFLSKNRDLAPFLRDFWPSDNWQSIIDSKRAQKPDRQLLRNVLKAQNQHLPNAGKVLEAIDALADEKTFTVTTGHQVCLAGGPMFTLYKIATTIALAKKLNAQHPAYRFVPLLWMATEDHDWAEVNHFYPSFDEKRVYEANVDGPVGRHVLQANIQETFSDQADWLKSIYKPGQTMAEAFRNLMHAIFGAEGLVILDADDRSLKTAFSGIMEAELDGRGIGDALASQTEALEALGYKSQVYPRGINLFWMGDGGRKLLLESAGGFSTKEGDKTWTKSEILAELAENPQNFSPNVAFRPLYQEFLLPNLAYVGGWAEVSYWMQFKAAFAHHQIPFPLLVPRLHATIFSAEKAEDWQELGFSLAEIAKPLHELQDLYIDRHFDQGPLLSAIESVANAYENVAEALEVFDPTLGTSMRGEKARNVSSLENWQKKVKKALKNRYPKPFAKIEAIKQAVDPENMPQQRTLNLSAFDLEASEWGKCLLEIAEPENPTQKWTILP